MLLSSSGIHMYQFTFNLHFCFRTWLWFLISTKILVDRRIWRKTERHGLEDLRTPIHPPRELRKLYFSNSARKSSVVCLSCPRVTTSPRSNAFALPCPRVLVPSLVTSLYMRLFEIARKLNFVFLQSMKLK